MRFPRNIRVVGFAALLGTATLAACDDPFRLLPASFVNAVDTVTVYALRGTSVGLPSGFDVANGIPARTDIAAFDFAFDMGAAGELVLYPQGALGLERFAGIAKVTQPFDSILTAPLTGYVDSVATTVSTGTVFVVRSRPYIIGCELVGELPRYGKFRVLSSDPVQRSLTLEVLVDLNCGYRGLEPGTPSD